MTLLDIESAPAPADTDVKKIADLARRQVTIQKDIAYHEGLLKELNESLRQVSEIDLPEAMSACGVESFGLKGGWSVAVDKQVYASIPKDKADAAHAWLEANGHGALIKHVITVSFGKGENAWAQKFLRDMAQRKKPLNAQRKDAVHPQTLGAFVREQIGNWDQVTRDLFGVFVKRVAVISPPKEQQ